MNVLIHISDIIVPALIFYIIAFGLANRVSVYEVFLKGAEKGLKTVTEILPALTGLMVAVGVLRASGFLTFLTGLLEPVGKLFSLPGEILPLLTVKLFSSSAATGLVLDIFQTAGPDSYVGTLTSILMSCTETVFYTMSVYFLAVKVTKTRYTLTGAFLATLAGIVMSVILAGVMCR